MDNDFDMALSSYALLSLGKYRSCLLISDGTDFATELGVIAQEAGFTLITLSTTLPFHELEEAGEDILRAHELLILVRGEHYIRGMNEDFYLRLRRFVLGGGALFATSWVSWETKYLHEFVNVLPFIHVRDTYMCPAKKCRVSPRCMAMSATTLSLSTSQWSSLRHCRIRPHT